MILKEVFIFDIYQCDLLKENDVVLDLGATIGEFSILASKRVGKNGKVIAIEPNIEDYQLLKLNIQRNDCRNIIPINLAVGNHVGETEITFLGSSFKCKLNTLENILKGLDIQDKINFVKMDIEGFEMSVVEQSNKIFHECNVISVECHNTKEAMDKLLLPHGFSFQAIDAKYLYKKMIQNLFSHPNHFFKAAIHTIAHNPKLIYKVFRGYDVAGDPDHNPDRLIIGAYVRDR